VNATESRLVIEVLDTLKSIVDSAMSPSDAMQEIERVGAANPGIPLDLVWDDNADGSGRHYDVLLRSQQGSTISLSHCPDRALPWPLRGARRFSDADLLRVNDMVLTVGEAVGQIDAMLDDRTISMRLIDTCLVREELTRHPVELSIDDLQRASDAFRRTHRLYTTADYDRWMARRGLSPAQFESLVNDHAEVAALKRRLTAGEVPTFFEAHREAFDVACVAEIVCEDRADAARTCSDIAAGRRDFYDVAQTCFVAANPGENTASPLFRTVRRGLEPAPWVHAIFEAAPGTVLGPLELGGAYAAIKVLSVAAARLDEPTRVEVQRQLFARWLGERRDTARIEWFWHDRD
jgi:putative peptide maturation system protein